MKEPPRNICFRNLPNVVSILGVLPLCILFWEEGYKWLIPLIVYNNIMDDLDGILASKLNLKSEFGALLDNVCDAIAHTVLVMFVGMTYAWETGNSYLGGICLAGSLLAAVAVMVRSVARLKPASVAVRGSPTNELIRHIFFVLLIAQVFEFDPTLFLIASFVLHAVSMLVPFQMPYLIRSFTKSAVAIGILNLSLMAACLVPYTAPFIGALFFITYLSSFIAGGIGWIGKANTEAAQ